VSYKSGDSSLYGSVCDGGGIRNFLRSLAISFGSSILMFGPFKSSSPAKPSFHGNRPIHSQQQKVEPQTKPRKIYHFQKPNLILSLRAVK
jgi:hypothetical protein